MKNLQINYQHKTMRINSKNKVDYTHYYMAIIIGRFQIADLHGAHVALINEVKEKHPQVAIFLGVSQVVGTRKYPLDFTSRKYMIQELYPEINVMPMPDMRDNAKW